MLTLVLMTATLAAGADPVIVREADVAKVITVQKGDEVVIELPRIYGEFTRWRVTDNKIAADGKHKQESHVVKSKELAVTGATEVTYVRFTADKERLGRGEIRVHDGR